MLDNEVGINKHSSLGLESPFQGEGHTDLPGFSSRLGARPGKTEGRLKARVPDESADFSDTRQQACRMPCAKRLLILPLQMNRGGCCYLIDSFLRPYSGRLRPKA
jgi:hypothetical protein